MSDSFFKEDPAEKSSQEIPNLSSEETKNSQESENDLFSTDEGRMAAIMSYIPILCFVPLLNMKENKEARFHARQGVMIFLIELITIIFLIDGISDFVFKAILILAIGFSVAGIYFSLRGKNYKLPIIGDLADKSKF